MPRQYVRHPKRVTRRNGKFAAIGAGFVRAANNVITVSQNAVQRVGNTILGGDYTGNARGDGAIDIQIARTSPSMVAGGIRAIAFGRDVTAEGSDSVAIGYQSAAIGNESHAFGIASNAEGTNSAAIGSHAEALGNRAIAIGYGGSASDNHTVALGESALAVGNNSIAIGKGARTSADDECVIACTVLKTQNGATYKTVIAVATPPTITGSRGGNVALANLLTQLAALGIITDSTS